MGLINWYPLNGDIKNNISNGISLRNNGCVEHNSGKIGKCYDFNGSGRYMDLSIDIKEQTYTFSAWGYLTSATSCMLFSLTKSSGPDLYVTSGTLCWNTGDGASNPFKKNGVNCPIPSINVWHLYVVISNKELNKVDLYIDGVYSGTAAYRAVACSRVVLGNYVGSHETYYWRGRINDFRIYDHALSEADIIELKNAKILHYTFSSIIEPRTNVVSNNMYVYNNYGSKGVTGALTLLSETYNGMPIYRLRMTATTAEGASNLNVQGFHSKGIYQHSDVNITTDSKWSYGVFFRPVTHSNVRVGGTASNISGWVAYNQFSVGNGWQLTGRYRTETPSANDAVHTSWYVPNSTFKMGDYVEIDFTCPMLIKGSSVVPHAYVPKGVTYTLIKDSSGYGNDATITPSNFAAWEITDVPRGFGKYKFEGTNNIITNKLFFDNTNQSWTISCWVKITEACDGSYFNNWNSGNYIQFSTTKKGLLYLNSGANDSYTYSNSAYPLNTWMMLTYVHDRDTLTCKIYKDGVLFGSSVNYASTDMPSGFPNNTVFGGALKGYMSDIRVYANMLTASEILDLYNAPISIDSCGNMRASYFDVTADNKGLTKQGIVGISGVSEAFTPGNTSVKDDSGNTQIIECRWNASSKKMECRGLASFTCLGVAMTTSWRTDINPNIFKQRVVAEIGNGTTISCNEIFEV